MPDVLWPIFQRNRKLLHDLPALAAAVIQQSVKAKYGVRVLILVVPHTFGRHLNFNAHLHVMVSAGGLKESGVCWITPLRFDGRKLMQMWRYAVITYLRAALKKGSLVSEASAEELSAMLETQYERWWNVYVASIKSKWHFLRYVARYVRRPPIAQHRFTKITSREVEFLTKDLKEKRVVTTHYLMEEFVDALAAHVLDHYRRAMRRFGLLAPRAQRETSAALFALLGQKKRPHPQRLNWRNSTGAEFATAEGIGGALIKAGETMAPAALKKMASTLFAGRMDVAGRAIDTYLSQPALAGVKLDLQTPINSSSRLGRHCCLGCLGNSQAVAWGKAAGTAVTGQKPTVMDAASFAA